MTPEQNGGVRLSTVYMLVMNLYLSMLLVLLASLPEVRDWFRYFALAYLFGMEVAFLVLTLRARKAEQRQKERPPA